MTSIFSIYVFKVTFIVSKMRPLNDIGETPCQPCDGKCMGSVVLNREFTLLLASWHTLACSFTDQSEGFQECHWFRAWMLCFRWGSFACCSCKWGISLSRYDLITLIWKKKTKQKKQTAQTELFVFFLCWLHQRPASAVFSQEARQWEQSANPIL